MQGRPFQCLQCPAAFTCKQYLEIHNRTHTGERPYQCDVCLKRFAQKSTLNIHKRTHTGESRRTYATAFTFDDIHIHLPSGSMFVCKLITFKLSVPHVRVVVRSRVDCRVYIKAVESRLVRRTRKCCAVKV